LRCSAKLDDRVHSGFFMPTTHKLKCLHGIIIINCISILRILKTDIHKSVYQLFNNIIQKFSILVMSMRSLTAATTGFGLLEKLHIVTGRLHGTIVGPTGRSDQSDEAFTRSDRRTDWSARPRLRSTGRSDHVGPTGRTDCSRTAHRPICQSNQCGLLAD